MFLLVAALLTAALPPPRAPAGATGSWLLPTARAEEAPPPMSGPGAGGDQGAEGEPGPDRKPGAGEGREPSPSAGGPGAGVGAFVEVGGGPVWPVGGRPAVLRGWEPPSTPYGPGHRGVDLAASPGTVVLAAATGRVSFAGRVAGRGVLAIELAGSGAPPLRTTYEPVRALVRKGDLVVAGQPVGLLEAGPFHCATGCLHWGLRRGKAYLNPLSLLRRGPSRLLPVFGLPEPAGAAVPGAAGLSPVRRAGSWRRRCPR
ncbi:murein hydrolase activator EnvC family protein [Streptomyces sp. NPDC059452]|uniref:murein hydrolase activator EnvC family protein n=1 Tax=Streptomyces sp. NPDC059452 TaxID=3346835 RepID=UPI0036848DD6